MASLRLIPLLLSALLVAAQNEAPSASVAISATITAAASSTSSALPPPPTESTYYVIPISPVAFTPLPSPSNPGPIPGVFPSAVPNNPPPVSSDPTLVPDFAPAWTVAWEKAKAKIAGFTLEEKVNVTTGVGWMNGRCVGNIPPVYPIDGRGWPGLCLEDSPLGVRYTNFVTAFPAGINTAATWNRALIRLRGIYMGQEFVGKGVHVQLGPMMNLGKNAQGGRNWEGFGAEPFLAGEAAYETILGMQQSGVQACAKHYINNEQEFDRTQESSNVDDRTEHEIYGHPFMRSVMAGVASVMCSYNLINDTYACENDRTLNQILKYEYGFQGYIQSDWSATHSTMGATAGLDMTMPGDIAFGSNTSYFGYNLTQFVLNGTIQESRLDDMATRIVAAWYLLGQDAPTFPNVSFNAFYPLDPTQNENIDVMADHYTVVHDIGAASTILLKNVNNTLPLKGVRSIAMIGSDAGPDLRGPNGYTDRGGDDGVLAMGWGSGTDNFPWLISPLEAIQARARQDHTLVSWFLDDFDYAGVATAVQGQEMAIVFVNSDSGEGYITVDGNEGDRKNLTAWHGGDELILTVAANNNNTVVVVHSVGPLIIEPWVDHPNITAILWAGVPGQEVGNSLVSILYGVWNPTGRLPYTIAKNASDYPSQLILGGTPQDILSINYTQGLFIDYRWFDAQNITPRYEFGYGLSYSTFKYSNVEVTKVYNADDAYDAELIANWEAGKPNPLTVGSTTALWLHTPAYQVSFDVTNTGDYYGGEIPQLYVHFPPESGEPPQVLKGFTNMNLVPGETQRGTITLSRYSLSIWDIASQGWLKPSGTITFTVGASSRDPRLHGTFPL
ncbi:glycoside hydrolase family 3 protein [Neolentinus lepideus HHB14362 ss-1]|uniref:beta-glucosidase n=1 Tax=Neolentinus lepideus HHB14362 ss-1 TaxID=1314782 RepID=A0A165SCX0_9AGAM|nr:glycoside hydrolase family 3 protein [Neolentinus lepideus HHB14362 ss-1]